MAVFRSLLLLIAAIGAGPATALTPLPDGRPGFFAGDWVGTGADDVYCFVRLQADGSGTVLVEGGSGDWLGARIQWRNERQHVVLVDVSPLPFDPGRRLMPLSRLLLSSGVNRTLQLRWSDRRSACELQWQVDVQHRTDQARKLLEPGPQRRARHDAR
jgi:hypothetical protein